MVRITAQEPIEQFAEKVALRTGISRQNVVQVLAAAMILGKEFTDISSRSGGYDAASNNAVRQPASTGWKNSAN